jgi:hypothetical protein
LIDRLPVPAASVIWLTAGLAALQLAVREQGMKRTVRVTAAETFGETLERRRLEFRERRLERVVGALRHRELTRHHHGQAPAPLREAIARFSGEMTAVRQRLDALRR